MTKQEKLKAEFKNHAIHCIWLGYANSHDIGTYCVLNLKTKQVMLTQVAVFMKKAYFQDENESKQKENIEIKNNIEDKYNLRKDKCK